VGDPNNQISPYIPSIAFADLEEPTTTRLPVTSESNALLADALQVSSSAMWEFTLTSSKWFHMPIEPILFFIYHLDSSASLSNLQYSLWLLSFQPIVWQSCLTFSALMCKWRHEDAYLAAVPEKGAPCAIFSVSGFLPQVWHVIFSWPVSACFLTQSLSSGSFFSPTGSV
jgi:hypothetical protein